ncbi:MAG: hypothetical protein RQ826_15260, partial [Xanthomonadales bacterium]|nr:hypothetical protein [Xanthomonadales bacterium]
MEKNFDDFISRHLFLIKGATETSFYSRYANVILAGPSRRAQVKYLTQVAHELHSADKIILHGLFNIHVVLLLALMPWVSHKAYWI